MSMDTISLLAPAFVAGVIISFAHVALGREVLKRGIIFLDLAVAQCAALGMTAFMALGVDEYSYLGMYGPLAAGLAAALICAGAFHILEKYAGQYQEALIGCVFVRAASLSLLVVANDPHGGETMKNILAGQILWAEWYGVMLAAPVFLAVALIWMLFRAKRAVLFYPLFALTIPFSVNLIGVYLVFSSLIFPALAVAGIQKRAFLFGILLSIFSYAAGLFLSYLCDWPAGPAIVLSMALTSLTFFITHKKCRHPQE